MTPEVRTFTRRVYAILAGIVFALFVSGAIFTALLVANADRSRENQALVEQINSERARNIRVDCVDVNERYSHSIAVLDRVLAQLPPERRRRARDSRRFTAALIRAVVPQRDCDRYVRRMTR